MSTPTNVATAMVSYMQALYAACNSPAAAINFFINLINKASLPEIVSQSNIGQAQQLMQNSMLALWRRTAILMLAQAELVYQPSSYNDAENVRLLICDVIDNEITIAGDSGDDASFLSLKMLRADIVRDLTIRGAQLAPLTTVKVSANLPSLALAYELYQDISRTDQLTSAAAPVHPAFMPTTFSALAY